MVKMQGAKIMGEGRVIKYMTKPEAESHAADWPL